MSTIVTQEAEKVFRLAFLNLQADLPVVTKSAENPHFKSRYADLPAIMQAIKPLLTKHGFILYQSLKASEVANILVMTTTLQHTDGAFISSEGTMPLDKVTPQGYGSAITYLRRYSIGALLGIVTDEDDDGNTASGIDHGKAMSTTISDKQSKRGWAIAGKAGYSQSDIFAMLNSKGVKGMENLTVEQYNNFMEYLEKNPKAAQ